MQASGPTLMGIDVLWVATILSGVAAFAVMIAIYAATTVSDPMSKRVKSLNDRREQLKAGITASTKRRAKLIQRNDTTDLMRTMLSSLKVLQDSQVKEAQLKLMRAGIHVKVVSERLGHSSVLVTLDRYSHVLPDMQNEAAEAADLLLAPLLRLT